MSLSEPMLGFFLCSFYLFLKTLLIFVVCFLFYFILLLRTYCHMCWDTPSLSATRLLEISHWIASLKSVKLQSLRQAATNSKKLRCGRNLFFTKLSYMCKHKSDLSFELGAVLEWFISVLVAQKQQAKILPWKLCGWWKWKRAENKPESKLWRSLKKSANLSLITAKTWGKSIKMTTQNKQKQRYINYKCQKIKSQKYTMWHPFTVCCTGKEKTQNRLDIESDLWVDTMTQCFRLI